MVSEATRAVEAMGAELALGQAYGLDKILERVKLERSQAEPVAHDAYHALVFGRARFGILLKILVLVAFKLLDNPARYKLKVAL